MDDMTVDAKDRARKAARQVFGDDNGDIKDLEGSIHSTQNLASLGALLSQTPYQSYSYSYPHKSAYGYLPEPVSLQAAWRDEDVNALFCYIHIPFCEFRCGFCNLFTLSSPRDQLTEHYVSALIRQMQVTQHALPMARFARFAMGGGTPSYLDESQLERVLTAAARVLGIEFQNTPACVEVSPATATVEKLALLKDFHIDRISMGVQSFLAAENQRLCRPQDSQNVMRVVDAVRKLDFPTLNIDLIYGIEGQTIDSWLRSLQTAVSLEVEELYLYPLYLRPVTGLSKIQNRGDTVETSVDSRMQMYTVGRDYLLSQGYQQISMRMFRASHALGDQGPVYCCQDDGMIGLGSGARSYTRRLHYSGEYGVSRKVSKDIIQAYCANSEQDFAQIKYGVLLDAREQRRRYAIQSILLAQGLDKNAYHQRFNSDVMDDLPQLRQLTQLGLATQSPQCLKLTPEGLARADTIGPWLVSDRMHNRMQRFQVR